MQSFGAPERRAEIPERKEVERHTCRPSWLRDSPTQDEQLMRRSRQLYLLSVYGIGGCQVIELSEQQMDRWFAFAMRNRKADVGMHILLANAIPKAYENVISDGNDCREYFLGKHNQRVRETKTTASQIRLCLARIGEVKDIMDRALAKPLLMTNTRLLKSRVGKQLSRIGTIGSEGGSLEHAFLDFVPKAGIGSQVMVHRNIACEII